MKRQVVMGLSGGMDSATLLGILLHEGAEVHVCNFIYGSKHNEYEQAAAISLVAHYMTLKQPVTLHEFDLRDAFSRIKSNLLKSGGEIPEGHYEAESMKLTVVPGRNLIFAAVMAGLAESLGATSVALGVHSGDHAIYADCRPAFIQSLAQTIKESSDYKVQVDTPLLFEDKVSILRLGLALPNPVPYEITRTCYKDQKKSCGKCGSCIERLEAFAKLGIKDPIKYQKHKK